jgi:hypothetical protein
MFSYTILKLEESFLQLLYTFSFCSSFLRASAVDGRWPETSLASQMASVYQAGKPSTRFPFERHVKCWEILAGIIRNVSVSFSIESEVFKQVFIVWPFHQSLHRYSNLPTYIKAGGSPSPAAPHETPRGKTTLYRMIIRWVLVAGRVAHSLFVRCGEVFF